MIQMSELTLERLYHPDGKHLGSLWSGLSGSGKTTAVLSSLQAAGSSKEFGEYHRFVIVDPKTQPNDYDILAEPILDVGKAIDSMHSERFTVFWPDLDYVEQEVTELVNAMFRISDAEPKTTFTFVLDEASTLITPTKIPTALKRVAVQGRAKRIKPIFISQRPIVNRWTDANLSNMLLMKTLPVDADTLKKRWGVDFDSAEESLSEPYSFLWFNLETADITVMPPMPLPKPPKKKKKSRVQRFFDRF
jgi:hypothetical protein